VLGKGPQELHKSQRAHALPVHRRFALGTSWEEILPQIFSANYKVLEKADFSSTEKLLF